MPRKQKDYYDFGEGAPDPDYIYFPAGFLEPIPQVMWKSVNGVETKETVMVCDNWLHAKETRGKVAEKSTLLPYSENMWYVCVQYIYYRQNALDTIRSRYNTLRAGQIPMGL